MSAFKKQEKNLNIPEGVEIDYGGEILFTSVYPYYFENRTDNEIIQFINDHTYTGDRSGYTVKSTCQCSEVICPE